MLTLAGAVGCSSDVSAADIFPPPTSTVYDKVQTAFEPRPSLLITSGNFPISDEAVRKTYHSFASIDLSFFDTNNDLPPPDSSPYLSPNAPDWPDPSTFQGESVYLNYAAAFRDTLYPYGVFFVNHYYANDTTSTNSACQNTMVRGLLWGATYAPTPNTVVSDRRQRISFVFVSDDQALVQNACAKGQQAVEYALIHVVTHEYGHQRAGLTDKDSVYDQQDLIYHQGSVPSGRVEVMSEYMSNQEFLSNAYPVFDEYQADTTCQHNTCKGNLRCNRTVQ